MIAKHNSPDSTAKRRAGAKHSLDLKSRIAKEESRLAEIRKQQLDISTERATKQMLDEAIAGLNREKEVMKSEIDTREAEHTANLDHRIKLEMNKLESLHLEIRAEHERLGSLTGKADAPWDARKPLEIPALRHN